jgi:hypothetical protein
VNKRRPGHNPTQPDSKRIAYAIPCPFLKFFRWHVW